MDKFNIETVIKSGVDKALNTPVAGGKSITEWAAIGMKAPRWISVKDKLPTSIVNKVLVWLEHEDLNGYLGFGHYEKYKGQEIWYDLEHNEAFSIRGYAVTHWMPLPEPPEEDNDGRV